MSQLTINAVCDKCDKEFGVCIEWLSRESAAEEILKTNCPNCNHSDWHFLDTAEH